MALAVHFQTGFAYILFLKIKVITVNFLGKPLFLSSSNVEAYAKKAALMFNHERIIKELGTAEVKRLDDFRREKDTSISS